MSPPEPSRGHRPGPPRFIHADELIVDPIFVDSQHGLDRDNLAPSIDGPAERDPDPYDPEAFSWSLIGRPDDSDAIVEFAPSPYDDVEQYDHGDHHTAEFRPDVPGTYVFELDAPDGTHRQTVRVFPAAPDDTGGPPRLELDGRYEAETDEFVLVADAELSPTSNAFRDGLTVEWLPEDGTELSLSDVTIESPITESTTPPSEDDEVVGQRVRIPADALDGSTRLFAAPYDGHVVGNVDEIVLNPDAGTVELPNRPPAWLDDAVVYEIFTRSFASEPGETDFEFLAEQVSYLDELGIDVVWLTPIVPAWSAQVDRAPGGPHAYSTEDYFDTADDLGTIEEYKRFVETCHDHDIRVCFDLVINHAGWTNSRFQDTIAELGEDIGDQYVLPHVEAWDSDSPYFDWFDRRADGTDTDAAPAATYFFGTRLQPNLNYGNVALREHIMAAAEFWAPKVDAFRCDIAWGVPHSFWKELRRRVRSMDSEFMLLDETIPRMPSFAESEFDAHFDTTGFMDAAHAVARGDRPASDLVRAIEKRFIDGFPTFTRILNTTENHDERRLYYEAKTEGRREDVPKAQRAAMAAAVTLPGVPFVLYGQERLIGEYGTPREAAFDEDDDRSDDDIKNDPYKRAFMNWDEYPDEHFRFYRDLFELYHELDVLGPGADLAQAPHSNVDPDDVLVFGRETDEQSVVVVINFGDGPATVDLRNVVDPCNLFTGENCETGSPDHATRVEVETLGVFETPSVLGPSHRP
ncbi:alpha-amylase family glycosyl hydrolase [Halapricum desulfuricans]|nr:alpha-amylase family glycosyl hydrolase [Halapricum desulfuricans]